MAEEKIEIAERMAAAFDEGNWSVGEALCTDEVEAQAPTGWPEGEDAKGWAAARRQFERLKDSWEDDRWEVDSTEAASPETVLQHGHWRGRGKGSGIDVDLETWIVYRFADGKVSRLEFYIDREQAMRAVGR
jgi:ketosteroid isomerase-like protein